MERVPRDEQWAVPEQGRVVGEGKRPRKRRKAEIQLEARESWGGSQAPATDEMDSAYEGCPEKFSKEAYQTFKMSKTINFEPPTLNIFLNDPSEISGLPSSGDFQIFARLSPSGNNWATGSFLEKTGVGFFIGPIQVGPCSEIEMAKYKFAGSGGGSVQFPRYAQTARVRMQVFELESIANAYPHLLTASDELKAGILSPAQATFCLTPEISVGVKMTGEGSVVFELARLVLSLQGAQKLNNFESVLLTPLEMANLFLSYYDLLMDSLLVKMKNRSVYTREAAPPNLDAILPTILLPLSQWLGRETSIELLEDGGAGGDREMIGAEIRHSLRSLTAERLRHIIGHLPAFWDAAQRKSRVAKDSFDLLLAFLISRRGIAQVSDHFFHHAQEISDQLNSLASTNRR